MNPKNPEDDGYYDGIPNDCDGEDDAVDYDGREYVFVAKVYALLSQTTLKANARPKIIKDPACYRVALDAILYETPISGITFSIYNEKEQRVDSHKANEYGYISLAT
jgi:hypothetical protein